MSPSAVSSRGTRVAVAGLLAGSLALAGCSKSASDATTPAVSSSDSAPASVAPSVADSNAAQQVVTPTDPPSSAGTSQAPTAAAGCTYTQYGAPKVDLKSTTVGFSQSEPESNPFRATETKSITAEAKRLGIKLITRNANANVDKQNQDIQALIAQGAKVLIVAPNNSTGLAPSLAEAKSKKIPVLTIDRTVDGTACQDFIGFIGSNFLQQAVIAADDMGGALNGKGKVAILQGTPGNNVAADRTKGFVDTIKSKYPGISVVASQTANFDQATGQKVAAQILQANPGLTGIYAENDGMAIGAIQAIRAAGKMPGKDIKVVGIDGIQQAVQDVANGTMVATVETNPRFGPLAFQTLQDFYSAKGAPTKVIIKDHHFTADNAKQALTDGSVY